MVAFLVNEHSEFMTDLNKASENKCASEASETAAIESTRVCCLIVTMPKNLLTKAKAVERTWGKRCDQRYYVSEPLYANATNDQKSFAKKIELPHFPEILVGRKHLIQKTVFGYIYAYEKFYNSCDWFLKADDDTYIIMHNLKKFLSQQNTSEPKTYGYNFRVSYCSMTYSIK